MIRRKLSLEALLVCGLAVWFSVPSTPAKATVAMQTPELARIEVMAESGMDQFVHRRFKAAQKTSRHILHAFYNLRRHASRKHYDERRERELATMDLWLRQMYISIRKRSGIGGAIAANQLTAALIRYQEFPDTVKSSIAWLAYLSRDIVLLNMEGARQNASLLEFRRNDLQVTWHTLRQLLLKDMRNKAVTLRVDGVVDHLMHHPDKDSQIEDGNKLLALIDELDKLPDPLQETAKK